MRERKWPPLAKEPVFLEEPGLHYSKNLEGTFRKVRDKGDAMRSQWKVSEAGEESGVRKGVYEATRRSDPQR